MIRNKNQTTIAISRKNRDALRTYGRAGDTSNDVITILLDMANNVRGNTFTGPLTEKNAQVKTAKKVCRSL
jgi:hypothetical protein